MKRYTPFPIINTLVPRLDICKCTQVELWSGHPVSNKEDKISTLIPIVLRSVIHRRRDDRGFENRRPKFRSQKGDCFRLRLSTRTERCRDEKEFRSTFNVVDRLTPRVRRTLDSLLVPSRLLHPQSPGTNLRPYFSNQSNRP